MNNKPTKAKSEQKEKREDSAEHKQKSDTQIIKLGICAMKKKIQAKPMQQIMKRIACKYIEIIIIDDKYWDQHYKTWPAVNALICFYSQGFPYMKAWKYVQYTKPFLINDLDKQQMLWDRTLVYSELKKYNIPISKNYFVCRKRESVKEFYKKRNSEMDVEDQILYSPNVKLKELSQGSQHEQCEELEEPGEVVKLSSFYKPSSSTGQVDEKNPIQVVQDISPFQFESKNPPLIDVIQKRNSQSRNLYFEHDKKKPTGYKRKSTTINVKTRNPVNVLKEYFSMQTYEDYQVEEKDDAIIIGKHILKKPFIEKPFDAQNHEVCIYYPIRDGGGRKMLFRKKQNCSSSYEPLVNKIRIDGNYIYEQFLRTNGFDIKVYTVGPYYMHAQARKAPSLDGVVQRNQNGKEFRYPIVLTPEEKLIAQKIVKVFEQNVCGFDLLRSNGKSYVCDVNGWSFVKGNHKYYDDCSMILKRTIIQKFMPDKIKEIEGKFSEFGNFMNYVPNQFKPPTQEVKQNKEQLRSIVSIFRHGDRNPKQKMKLTVSDPRLLSFFNKQGKQVKLKDPKSLTKLLDITDQIVSGMKYQVTQQFLKLVQLKSVLQIGGHFQGLNRKVQMKAIDKIPDPDDPTKVIVKEALLILKWGGELTPQGESDAKELGKIYRLTKYPIQQGLISLHSSYRHDLKTYSSEEGRCLKTAAAFLKGFLDLEGDLTPIINSMINRDAKAQKLLDCGKDESDGYGIYTEKETRVLQQLLNANEPLIDSFSRHFDISSVQPKMKQVIIKLGSPRARLQKLLKELKQLTSVIAEIVSVKQSSYYINPQDVNTHSQLEPQSQSLALMYKRWYKLQKDLYDSKKKLFNISKIPDIYDSIMYDNNHNKNVLEKLYPNYMNLFESARDLAYFVVPNQYGIETTTKLETAKCIVAPLCKKIYNDLMFWKGEKMPGEEQYWRYTRADNNNKEWRHVRTRLYFTSSSHIYSIFHILTLGNKGELIASCEKELAQKVKNITYIGYLAHIDLLLYENLSAQPSNPKRFRLEFSFSPKYGTKNPNTNEKLILGHSQFTIEEIEIFFKHVLGDQWKKDLQ